MDNLSPSGKKQFYLHSFDYSMPNLNLNNPKVQDELLCVAKHWFDLGADGFRLDAATHYACDPLFRDNPLYEDGPNKGNQIRRYDVNTKGGEIFLNRLKELCNSYPVPKTLLAEYWYNTDADDRQRIIQLFENSACDAFFTGALNGKVEDFKSHVIRDMEVIPYGKKLNWAFSNHDLERVVSRCFGNNASFAKRSMLMSLLLTLPGSVCIYQGEELGMINPKDFNACKNADNDPKGIWANCNMPWDAGRSGFAMSDYSDDISRNIALHPDEEQYKLAANNQAYPNSMLLKTKELIAIRKNSIFNEYGNMLFIEDIENPLVVAFVRTNIDETKKILCAYNFSDEVINFVYNKIKYTLLPDSVLQEKL
jgi:alpha-glucosidase